MGFFNERYNDRDVTVRKNMRDLIDVYKRQDVQKLKQKLEKVDHVDKIIWYDDIADLSVPKEMLPEKVRKVFFNKNATMMIAMFKETTSSDNTMEAVTQMRKIVGKQCFISEMCIRDRLYISKINRIFINGKSIFSKCFHLDLSFFL